MRSVSDVFSDIVSNLQDIIRSEIRLAKAELRADMEKARAGAVMLVVGAMVASLCVFFLVLAAVAALAMVMPAWGASLLVAVVLGILAAILIASAIKQLRGMNAAPRTVQSIKENIAWTQQQRK